MELKFPGGTQQMQQLLHSGRALVAVDTETTGLSPRRDYIIELGAARFGAGGITGEPFSSFVRCPVPLSPFIRQLTGITDEMLSAAPSVYEVLPRFVDFVGGGDVVLVAHNARFDMDFLNAALDQVGLSPLANDFADTLVLARRLLPDLKKTAVDHPYSLQNLIRVLGLDTAREHRAWDDAASSAHLFLKLAAISPDAAGVSAGFAI